MIPTKLGYVLWLVLCIPIYIVNSIIFFFAISAGVPSMEAFWIAVFLGSPITHLITCAVMSMDAGGGTLRRERAK